MSPSKGQTLLCTIFVISMVAAADDDEFLTFLVIGDWGGELDRPDRREGQFKV